MTTKSKKSKAEGEDFRCKSLSPKEPQLDDDSPKRKEANYRSNKNTKESSMDEKLDLLIEELRGYRREFVNQFAGVEKELAVIKTEIVPNIAKNSVMISSLTRRVENMELREKRLNIVIHGLPYEKEESSENLRHKILDFMKINLKTKENEIYIEEWRRIGKWTAQKRPVVMCIKMRYVQRRDDKNGTG
ncbi:unnamed protein product [Allacma fusca]|uniref:Uncharacterized protein n=1 Tax=Allacma fusca TaxID=39272 RepID=A0A8J2P500_9HEXA|nr:unnamed protein product [Allacma fusca]